MNKDKKTIMIVICTSIMVACLSQVVYWAFLSEKVDGAVFVLIIIPLLIVFFNVVLAIKSRLKFYEYIFSVYLGFLLSIATMSVIILYNQPEHLPPGEKILQADILFVFFTFIIQAIVLLILNLASFIFYKIFKLQTF